MSVDRRRIDRITAPGYLEGLETRPLPEVRRMRDECEEEEGVLSFERRLLHGRMDILRAELGRRRGGETASLIDRLPEILADENPSRRGAYPRRDSLPDFDQPRRRVEKLISDNTLANLPRLPDEEIEQVLESLSEAERALSEGRRSVQAVLDSLSAEIVRRYRSGEAGADVSSVS